MLRSSQTLKWLLEAYSDGTKVKDKDGNIPLHFLCNNPNVTADMLKCVIEAYSDGAKVKDKDGNIPLHILCKNPNVTADMLKWLLEAYSDGAKVKDKDGNIPLHFLYGNSARSDDMANRLLEAYPDAEKEKNKYGLTPLQMRDGIVVYKRGTLTKYMEDKTVTKVIVFSPNCKVKKIGYCAFYECTALEKVNLPDSLEELVGEEGIYGAFGRCRNLQKVSFGSNLKIVGYSTFCQCIKLEAIVLKDKVTTIGKRAFRQCDNLSTVIWPESVTTVGDAVFMESSKLHELAGSDEQDDVIAFLKSKSPLMQLCVDDGELEEMKNILKGAPDAAKQKSTQQGRTPLSYYCQFGTSVKALNWLLEAYPNATKEKDICNFTPLHYLCSNSASSLPALIKCFAAANPDPSQLRGSQAPKSKLVFEMLSHLTIDEMKACPDTEKGIRAAIDEKKTLQTNNSTAMSNIVDQEARAKTTELQRRMVAQLQDGKADAAQATFKELRDFSIKQADRLRDLIDVVMNKYRTTDPGRYKALEVIPKSTPGQQQLPAPASLSVEDQVKFQIAAASWEEKGFREKMSELVNFFNGSEMTCEQVCEHYGIENSDGRWSKEFRTTAYKLEKNTSDVVKARFGPPKGFPRALVKTKEGLEEEAKTGKKYNGLRDLNRVTFELEDPLLMALLFEVLNTNFEVVGLKNKYLQETFKQPPDLHLNLDLGNGWLVEVQMLFRDILAIKKEDHKFYDVKRASSPWDVPDRLFKELADPVDALRAKLEELRHLEKVSKDVAVDGRVKELEAKIAAVESSADERMKRAEATTADERVKKAEAKIAEAAADERLKKVEAKISTVEAAADERVKKAEAKIAAMEAAADERMKKAEAKIAELEAENARLRVAAAQTPPPAPSPSPDLKILKRRSLRSGGGDKK